MRLVLSLAIAIISTSAYCDSFTKKPWPAELAKPKTAGPIRHWHSHGRSHLRWGSIMRGRRFSSPGIRILGGEPSANRRVVAIYYEEGTQGYLCSGLWVSARYVLTAAHCTCGARNIKVTNSEYAKPDHDDNSGEFWVSASIASKFSDIPCLFGRAFGDDLALLRLERPLRLSDERGENIAVCECYTLFPNIPLARRWTGGAPIPFTVAGYGYDGDIQGSSGLRRRADIRPRSLRALFCLGPVYRGLTCRSMREFALSDAGSSNGLAKDSCAGDSGGPVFVMEGEKMIPLGIVSRGLPIQQLAPHLGQCGSGGIYTHLGRLDVKNWLSRYIPVQGSCRQDATE